MIKVIIVEDEYLIRERIKVCIDWNSLDCEIVGEGADGEEALELVKCLSPELAIVDINIPLIDGLSFAKILHENYPDIKILILTGFSNFEYAREALKCGVQSYLLKPLNKEELGKCVVEIKEKIELERKMKKDLYELKQSCRESDRLFKEKFIQNLVEMEWNLDEACLNKKLSMYCPGLVDKTLVAAVVTIDRLEEKYEREMELWRFAVLNIFDEILSACGAHVISYDKFGRIFVLKNIDADSLEPFSKCCGKAKDHVSEYLKFTVTVGIGSIHDGIRKAGLSYKEALVAIKNKIILGKDNVILFDSLNNSEMEFMTLNNSFDLKQKLLIDLKFSNYAAISEKLDHIFNMMEKRRYSVDSFNLIFSEFMSIVSEFAYEKGIVLTEILGKDFSFENIIDGMESYTEIKNWICEIFARLTEVADNTIKSRSEEVVENAKAFIESNYSNENLYLDDIASSVFLNPSYLSNIFKKETGVSVNEFLKECRMNKAKELIEKDYQNICHISSLVGFSDQHYFSKCFKKHFGVSPSKYIESKK